MGFELSDGIAPTEVSQAAPVLETAPAVSVVETPVVIETTAEPAAEPTETTPAAPELKSHTEIKGMLSGEFDDGTNKPDAAPEGGKPAEIAPDAWQTVEYDLTTPEDIRLPPEGAARLQETFNKLRFSPELAVQARDAYFNELRQMRATEMQRWNDIFSEQRAAGRKEIADDPVIGTKEAMQTIFRTRDAVVPQEDRESFYKFMENTGASDRIEMARLFYRVNEYVERRVADALKPYREAKPPAPGVKAPPSNGAGTGRTGMRAFYDSTNPRH